MIRFFRTLRQRLLAENRVSRYLLYAVGEIVLVVIGILIALQVNNWNEKRMNASAEFKSLIDLKSEFDEEHGNLAELFQRKEQAEFDLREYLEQISSDQVSDAIKGDLVRPDVAGYTWSPTYSILNSLLSSGKLDNIQNDSLKYHLAGWNQFVKDYEFWEANYVNRFAALYEFESKYIPSYLMPKGDYSSGPPREHFRPEPSKSSKVELVSLLEYQNTLARTINSLHVQLIVANRILDESEKIRRLLQSEIEYRFH